MNSSVVSWMSPPVNHNPIFKGPYDNFPIDTLDEDFVALIGQDGGNYMFSPRSIETCGSAMIDNNISSSSNSNPNNSLYASFGLGQPRMLEQVPDNYSQFPNMIDHSCMISYPADQDSCDPIAQSFGNHNPSQDIQHLQVNPLPWNPEESGVGPEIVIGEKGEEPIKAEPAKKKARIRPPSQTYDHIIAERRRREQLSQLFVALSALVPGLKKMDKSSVLEDAIKYLKHLKERVEVLEAKAKKHEMESVVLVRKSQIIVENEDSSDKQSCTLEEQQLPEIEARSCENHLLLRVHCEKQRGVLVKLVNKIESMNMIVINTSASPFGNVTLDITIIAEMENEFNLTMKEVVTAIREAIQPGRA